MVLDWSGEISQDAATGDTQLPFKLVKGANGTYAVFTVRQSRMAQAEFSGIPLELTDTVRSGSFTFVQSVPSSVTLFSVRLPAGTEPVSMKPASVGPIDRNESGETLYTLPNKRMKLGDRQVVSVAYKPIEQIEIPSGKRSDPMTGIIVGLVVAALAVAVALVVVSRARNRNRPDSEA